jgi:flagellin
MPLTINHNLMAMNTARNLSKHYGVLSISSRRLSSGLRIGSSADDAAGLATREMMRSEVTALHQGIRNANDAISMVQTADGALQVIDEKLIRMKELAMQASTGTYNSDQRLIIDSEFQAMKSEIERIAQSTEFNGIKLLNGDLTRIETTGDELSANLMLHLDFNGNINDSSGNGFTSSSTGTSFVSGEEGSNAIEFNGTTSGLDTNFNMTGDQFTIQFWFNPQSVGPQEQQLFTSDATTNNRRYEIQMNAAGNIEVWYSNSITQNHVIVPGGVSLNDWHLITNTYDSGEYRLYMDGVEVISQNPGTGNVEFLADTSFGYDPHQAVHAFERFDGAMDDIRIYDKALSPEAIEDYYNVGGDVTLLSDDTPDVNEVTVHFGTGNGSAEDYYDVAIGSVTTDALGIDETQVDTQTRAQNALGEIDDAIVYKDGVRAHLGAMQNRLENTVANLEIQAENLQIAESRISDVDVAREMTEFVRRQILTQSAVAMLAQANNLPRMAMQLIGG